MTYTPWQEVWASWINTGSDSAGVNVMGRDCISDNFSYLADGADLQTTLNIYDMEKLW